MPLKLRTYLYLSLIILFTAGLYFPSLNNGFTTWDDPLHVIENPSIKSLSVNALLHHFKPTTQYMYHPLTMISYAIDWKLGTSEPYAFHASSLLLHLCNILFVFFLIFRIARQETAALLVALVFAIHPFNVEAVAWISGRKEVLFSFFFLAGVNFYLLSQNNSHVKRYYFFTFCCFLLGLLAKPTMVIFPLALVICDWWEGKKFNKAAVIKLAPFFLLSFFYGLFTFFLSLSDTTVGSAIYLFTTVQKILLVSYAAAFYAAKILFPISLSAVYSYPKFATPQEYVWCCTAVVAIVICLWFIYRFGSKRRYLIFGSVWYVLPLLLVLQILPFHNSSLVADRYAYISSVGIIFAFVMVILTEITPRFSHNYFFDTSFKILFGIIIIVFSTLTVQRISVWKDGETLFTDVINKNPRIWLAYGNRANAKIGKKEYKSAIEDCNSTIALNPADGKAYYNRGNIYSFLENYRAAVCDYDSALTRGTDMHYIFYNKGIALYQLNEPDSALMNFFKAKEKESAFPNAYYSIGYTLLQSKKKSGAAIAYFDSTIMLDRSYADAYYQRAKAYYDQKKYMRSLQDFSTAVLLNPYLRNDSMINVVNQALRSVTIELTRVNSVIDKDPRNRKNYLHRSELYSMVGDSIRAENDLRKGRN